MQKQLLIDNSSMTSFLRCPRMYFWRYVRDYVTTFKNYPIQFGTGWHSITEYYYLYIKEHGWDFRAQAMEYAVTKFQEDWPGDPEDDYRTAENLIQMFIRYLANFTGDNFEVLELEEEYTIPLATYDGVDIFVSGRIDMKIHWDNTLWIVERKSTGWSLSLLTQELETSPQPQGYLFHARESGKDPMGALLDIAQCSARRVKDGGFGKLTIDFQRVPLIISEDRLQDWKELVMWTAGNILNAYRLNIWPKNGTNCRKYNKNCEYRRLCDQGHRGLDPVVVDYVEDKWPVAGFKEVE